MYNIEKRSFGYHLIFGGFMELNEIQDWVIASKKALQSSPNEFGVFVDMRNLKPLPKRSQSEMEIGQKLFKDKGMNRSVVIVNSATAKMQFRRIAKETGIYEWERYIDASSEENWESIGIKWLEKKDDPDL